MAAPKRLSKMAEQKLALEKADREAEEFITSGKALTPNLLLHSQMVEKVQERIRVHYETVYTKFDIGNDELLYPLSFTPCSLFDGDGAVAYANFHLFRNLRDISYAKEGVRLLERHLRHMKIKTGFSFIRGEAGVIALGAVLYYKVGNRQQSKKLVRRLLDEVDEVCYSDEVKDNLVEGRAGFLYCLLFVRKQLGRHGCEIRDQDIQKMVTRIVRSGMETAEQKKKAGQLTKMLLYSFNNRLTFGAKTGMAGILHTLLLAVEEVSSVREVLCEYLPDTLDFMLSYKLESGNLPSDDISKEDVITAWCEGASGWVHLLARAAEFFREPRYLEAARAAEEVVWNRGYRGILKDRHGLCHGMAGNGYTHLALFRATNEPKYFQRACLVGVKCYRQNCNIFQPPQKPNSLFDGLCGTICFLSDLLDPKTALFPGFEV